MNKNHIFSNKGGDALPDSGKVLPPSIKVRVSWDENIKNVASVLKEHHLYSVCDEAACPNRSECWEKKHVTFIALGKNCSRSCKFCDVNKDLPYPVDPDEPFNIACAVKRLDLEYAVITSVTRDDLADMGARHMADIVREVKSVSPDTLVELLIADMKADKGLLEEIIHSGADVIGHNIEMPEELYKKIRPASDYTTSLDTLKILFESSRDIPIKTSLMLGLGETEEQVLDTFRDIRSAGVEILYLGQYLSPGADRWPVNKYYAEDDFKTIKEKAADMGFKVVEAGAFVRSSYRAKAAYIAWKESGRIVSGSC